MSPNYYVGVDGCKTGWLAVGINSNNEWQGEVFPDISQLWERCRTSSLILIDIPIGLKESGEEERKCDTRARKLLGPGRGSSVFRVPCRGAVYAESYKEACAINNRLTDRSLSLQTWGITAKIREVDIFLAENEFARTRIRETHPEICFYGLAGYPMNYRKTIRKGFCERYEILRPFFPEIDKLTEDALSKFRRSEVKEDDILDSLAAAVTAKEALKGLASIPETPEFDARDLPMEIVFRRHREIGP